MTANIQSISSVHVHRFTFTTEFNTELLSFSKIHQYDDRHAYKHAWDRWVENNALLVVSETQYLKNNGFQGNIMEKMFKSGRYYFRNKTHLVPSTPTSRRKYISLDMDIISTMDLHIERYCVTTNNDVKPSTGFILFLNDHSVDLLEETKRLSEHLTNREINEKYKKTYKNRFYLHTKQLQKRLQYTK
jgi:hypothetical protein